MLTGFQSSRYARLWKDGIASATPRRLGERLDVVALRRQVLGNGAMPLTMFEAKIERWDGRHGSLTFAGL